MAGDIFISYRSSEAQVVDQLYDGLINVGGFEPWQMWRDRNNLMAGQQWLSQLQNASSRARALVAVIGPGWRPKDSKGDWVTRELKVAFAHGIRVLPVLLGDAPMPKPDLIKAYQLCIEARGEYLNRIGTTPGEATSDLLNALQSPQ